jgi:hypothetical protein
MQGEKFQTEELEVAIAVRLSGEGFDFVVGSLQRTCRDWMVVLGEKTSAMGGQALGEFH